MEWFYRVVAAICAIEFTLSATTGQGTHTRHAVTEVGTAGQVPLQQWLRATPGIGLQFRITN